jgi:hypothetical protein
MKLFEIRKDIDIYTGKVSELCRTLSFAGLGIIWIFNHGSSGNISVPKELYYPALMFIISLSIDIFQYISEAIIWYLFYLWKRVSQKLKEEEEANEPEWISYFLYLIFFTKFVFLVLGYISIYTYLITKI